MAALGRTVSTCERLELVVNGVAALAAKGQKADRFGVSPKSLIASALAPCEIKISAVCLSLLFAA
jgi:hypothetical protein